MKNYQLIYNEKSDNEHLLHDDNQIYSERVSTRYSFRALPLYSFRSRTLPQLNSNRTPAIAAASTSSDIVLPLNAATNLNKSIHLRELKERIKPVKYVDETDRLIKLKALRAKYTFPLRTRSVDKFNNLTMKRSASSVHIFNGIPRRKHHFLDPINHDKRHNKREHTTKPTCTEEDKHDAITIEDEPEQPSQSTEPLMNIEQDSKENSPGVCTIH